MIGLWLRLSYFTIGDISVKIKKEVPGSFTGCLALDRLVYGQAMVGK